MYLKISGGNNKGSAGQLFSYLTKENEIEGKSDDFFNANLLTGENYADFRNSVHTLEEYKTERDQLFFKNHKMSDFINDFDIGLSVVIVIYFTLYPFLAFMVNTKSCRLFT